jgi:predicted membrane protein
MELTFMLITQKVNLYALAKIKLTDINQIQLLAIIWNQSALWVAFISFRITKMGFKELFWNPNN